MKILLAVDGSSCSKAALEQVARLPWPPGSEVRVITVDPPVDAGPLKGSLAKAFEEIAEEQLAEANKRVKDAAAFLAERAPQVQVSTAVMKGWAKEVIVAEAERWRPDLVVVGSHGYGPVQRFFLGSISHYVMNRAPCSVLVVRQPPEDRAEDE